MTLPNVGRAVVARRKIVDYLLSTEVPTEGRRLVSFSVSASVPTVGMSSPKH